jgi:hypothetical protein
MPYSQFKIRDLSSKLGLNIQKGDIVFPDTLPQIQPSAWLQQTLAMSRRVALTSEKARSELLVSPILMELLNRNNYAFSVLSGVNLDVDTQQGLNGECDFILAALPNLLDISSPIFALVEAKDNDIDQGIPQCAAQMYGARLYNMQENLDSDIIWGCVTTGTEWQFLRLEGTQITANTDLYHLSQLPILLGILQNIINTTITP